MTQEKKKLKQMLEQLNKVGPNALNHREFLKHFEIDLNRIQKLDDVLDKVFEDDDTTSITIPIKLKQIYE